MSVRVTERREEEEQGPLEKGFKFSLRGGERGDEKKEDAAYLFAGWNSKKVKLPLILGKKLPEPLTGKSSDTLAISKPSRLPNFLAF